MKKVFGPAFTKLGSYGPHTLWLLSDKIFKLLVGLFVTVWVARYLGPEQFGIFNYVFSFVALFAPIAKLGLDGIASRDIATHDSSHQLNELLSTVIFLKLTGALVLVLLSIVYMYLVENTLVHVSLALLFSLVFVVRSLEVSEFYFRIKVQGKIVSISNCWAVIVSSGLKIGLILLSFPLAYFAFANVLEAVIAMGMLLWFYLRINGSKLSWRLVNFSLAQKLLMESWPLIISGFSALIYLHVDQLMIESMLGAHALGQYSAASRLSSAVYFIPLAISWAMQSALIRERQKGLVQYHRFIASMCSFLFWIAILITLPVFVFSEWLVIFLYGDAYHAASSVLAIHMWACVFVFLGAPRGLWVTSESMFRFAMISNIFGGMINIGLNYLLLPVFGIVGAAWATLISFSFAYLFSGFLYGPVRVVAWLQIKSIFFVFAAWR